MRRSSALVAPLILLPALAFARPTRFDFESRAELFDDSFERVDNGGGGRSIFRDDGLLEVVTPDYEEWLTERGGGSRWWSHVHQEKGWYVEFRVRVVRGGECESGATGVWIHDGSKLFHVTMSATAVGFTYPFRTAVPMDTTSDFHVYRVWSSGDGKPHISVDGVEVDHATEPYFGGGSEVLMFGDLGGCRGSEALWDYFEYDTVAPGRSDFDSDFDGFIDSEDNCAFIPNDQADRDGDRRGDVCDACPDDAIDDSDGDGACDSADTCPSDPADADVNQNGTCDVDEICPCVGFDCRRAPPPCNEEGYPPGPPEDPIPANDDNNALDTISAKGCSCDTSSRAEVSVLVIAVLLVLSAVRARAVRSTQPKMRSRSRVR